MVYCPEKSILQRINILDHRARLLNLNIPTLAGPEYLSISSIYPPFEAFTIK